MILKTSWFWKHQHWTPGVIINHLYDDVVMLRVVHDLLFRTAETYADKKAVFFKEDSMTYSEIASESEKLAAALVDLGVAKGDRVAFYLEKRFEKVSSIFGISLAGGNMVPVRRLLHARQVSHILANSGSRILITTYSRISGLAEYMEEMPELQVIIGIGEKGDADNLNLGDVQILDWQELLKSMAGVRKSFGRVIESDLAAILYTSGSTGKPKGVVLSHLNIVTGARSVSEYLKITERDRLLSIITFSFDVGLNQLTGAFLHGAQLVMLDVLFPKQIVDTVQRYEITGLASIAAVWLQLLQIPWNGEKMPTLRYITNTGGAIPENYVRDLRKRLPKVDIYLMYGLTEAFRSTFLDPVLVDERPTSIGKAIPGEEIMVLDEHDRPVNPGEIGELVHRGPLVAQGYWGEPELTAYRYRRNPLQPKEVPIPEMVVYSGDYVRIDEEGFLYFIGRKDEMIKCAGNRVSPTEVEEMIYSTDKIQDAVVMGIPHEIYGQAIMAVLAARPGQEITKDEILTHCKRMLPPYMIPKEIEFREELPRNANGKLDRALVKKQVYERLKINK